MIKRAEAAASVVKAPAASEVIAPAHWQCVDFISDMHLCAQRPKTFEAWANYLDHTRANAVVILGDLFEVWVGDDARQLPFEQSCVEVLRRVGQQRDLAFMVGNRDFLLGDAMLAACCMQALLDPTRLVLGGQTLLLSHGDALCLDDTDYLAFRALVRAEEWQSQFLANSLTKRIDVAANIRNHSELRKQFDGATFADVDTPAAMAWLNAGQARTLIHGHTHRPANHTLAPGVMRYVLSDWDLDDTQAPRAEVLRWTSAGLTRISPMQAGL